MINGEILELEERKKELEMEIRSKKMADKNNFINKKSSTEVTRVSDKFWEEISKINSIRKNNQQDLITPAKITELIVRHINWEEIKEDLIDFNIKLEKNDE